MKTESEWLQNFRRNLDSELVQREDKERKHIIIWELSWIDDRLRQIAKHVGKYVKVEDKGEIELFDCHECGNLKPCVSDNLHGEGKYCGECIAKIMREDASVEKGEQSNENRS